MRRRLGLAGLASLLLHAGAWFALLFGPGLVGRKLAEPPQEAATVELVIGEGGQSVQPERGEEASPAPPGAPAPETPQDAQQAQAPMEATPPEEMPPEEMPPAEPDRADAPPDPGPLPALAPLRPPPRVVDAPPLPRVVLPSAPPPGSGGKPAVRLGDAGKPPHADLLDPENIRFRKATQDSGNLMPSYPLEAARKFESGTVKLQLFVDPAGKVVNAVILRSSGSAVLDGAARDQTLTWRFTPARRDGRAVADLVEIEIEFKLI